MTGLAPSCARRRDAAARAHRWAHGEPGADIEQWQPGQYARACHARHERILARARPSVGLLKTLHAPLNVEAPTGEPLAEHQTLHRDQDLRDPARVGAPRRGLPDAVPIGVLALSLVHDERIVARARGIDGEHVAGPCVAIAVEHALHEV